MTPDNRELLIRTAGIIDGLYCTASHEVKEALAIVSENVEYILTSEEERNKK